MNIKASQAVILVGMIGVTANIHNANAAGAFMEQAGTNCAAVNQNQAFAFQWNDKQLINLSETKPFWATCPVPRATNSISDPLNLIVSLENTSSLDQVVTCIIRRYNSDGAQLEAQVLDVTVTANSVANGLLELTDTPSDFNYYSLTCKLPPKVALSHYTNN
jgi:hypothetical protein